MTVVLGPNRYGKAETRVVRVVRDGGVHSIKDINVSSALSGDMEDVHLTGDNAAVLPTDTQKNTAYAFARKHGVEQIEDFALLLARHYVSSQPSIHHARVEIEEYFWDRIPVSGAQDRRHSFVRSGREVRTCVVHHDRDGRTTVVSGLKDLVVLNSTGSEFHGYITDEYTTLRPTTDRVLATAVSARWRHVSADSPFGESYDEVRRHLLEAFAGTHSLSLQQTLYAMGERVLENRGEVCEVRMAMPNKHHFLVDLEPFGMDNPNEVFYAADRPYGLIEGAVLTGDAPDACFAWE
ncbi:factor-independent urate hydroxylase [Planomonospora venezuelensis]|uniref:Uricase n=1 Tax=Planomonospora venezuelensis TaxID=1999 RepID=A0A841D0A9_PLAVE|nr:urate oxidase [Planomonospora venezuelensis]MBB5961818.1 urate oxidase [Planomonospora venezuelensis]GIM99116.1 uricase [Planomonospora venezuelensis]